MINIDEARKIESAMSPLPWIVLEETNGEMVVIRNPNHPIHQDGLEAWSSEDRANTPDARGIAYMRASFVECLDELARLREIAGCFADGDFDALKRVVDYMNYMYPRSSPYFGCAADIVMLERLQVAAKLAEDLCK